MTAEKIISLLELKPHPEGGFYRETYRSGDIIARLGGERCASTSIYYLITTESFSTLHRLASDEMFHFYLGDTVEMLQLLPGGTGKVVLLGNDVAGGARPQALVPRGTWQGSRLKQGGTFALLGTTMAPGFDSADFEPGRKDELLRLYPQFSDLIAALAEE